MASDAAAGAWARALFEVARADDAVEAVDADLKLAVETIRGHLKLKEALSDPAFPAGRKAAVITDVLGGEGISPTVIGAVVALVQQGRADQLARIREAYETVSEEVRGVAVADVTTAVELDDATRSRLATQLAKVAGKDVSIREHVDPEILGGVVVRMGGRVMDGSVRSKLGKLREQMVMTRSEA